MPLVITKSLIRQMTLKKSKPSQLESLGDKVAVGSVDLVKLEKMAGRFHLRRIVFSLFFATAKVACITAMIFLHIILHSAVHIYDFHIVITSTTKHNSTDG